MPGRRKFVLVSGAAAVAAACGGPSSPGAPTFVPTPSPTPAPPNRVHVPLPAVGQTVAAEGKLLLPLPLAVTRLSETVVVAVSRICTHMGCTVNLPLSPGQVLECPCHGSRFQVTGEVVNGPAERPLSSFPAAIQGAEVVVTLPNH